MLLRKELRELFASRAYWLLLLMIGPLVGQSFITAVDSYAEASGRNGAPAALAQGLSPLDGILVPAFGAYDLAVTLLFPFVAIRLVSAEKESGAWKLMLQVPASVFRQMGAKVMALLAGWAVAWIPALLALVLWKLSGGSLYAPELLNLLFGHLLRMLLSAAVAVAAAAITANGASAAIVALGFTVGTWALDFIALGRGGFLQRIAAFTPEAALRSFEQGNLKLSTVLVTSELALAGFALASVWLTTHHRFKPSLAIVAAAVVSGLVFGHLRPSWDLSENRRNSFSRKQEAALASIREPLRITVNLAPEDPRLTDLERNILAKLQRILPQVAITYSSQTRAGLFESARYGEVWYELNGRKAMSRSTTEPIVLEVIFQLAGLNPPAPAEEQVYAGHPLAARPAGAPLCFYFAWPLLVGVLYFARSLLISIKEMASSA